MGIYLVPPGGRREETEWDGTDSFEDNASNTKEKVLGAINEASRTIWDTSWQLAPDYAKVSGKLGPIAAEGSIDRYLRPYLSGGTDVGNYANRTGLNFLDKTRPRGFGIGAKGFAFGWFLNVNNESREIEDAMNGANVTVQY